MLSHVVGEDLSEILAALRSGVGVDLDDPNTEETIAGISDSSSSRQIMAEGVCNNAVFFKKLAITNSREQWVNKGIGVLIIAFVAAVKNDSTFGSFGSPVGSCTLTWRVLVYDVQFMSVLPIRRSAGLRRRLSRLLASRP